MDIRVSVMLHFFQTELATVSSIFVAIRDVRRHVVTVIQVTSRWGVSASRRHRRQDGWTSTPHACGDEQAGGATAETTPQGLGPCTGGLSALQGVSNLSFSLSLSLSFYSLSLSNAAKTTQRRSESDDSKITTLGAVWWTIGRVAGS